MNPLLTDITNILKLERLGPDRFEGEGRDASGLRRVFGGLVLGQALSAAYQTTEQRPVHSLHAYFLRGGDPDHPIVYEVDRSRDGGSFSNRRVVAIQHGAQIFHLSASFHAPEPSVDRYLPMPDVAPPEELPTLAAMIAEMKRTRPDRPVPFIEQTLPFEFRPAYMPDPETAPDEVLQKPHMKLWIRTIDQLPDDAVLHHTLMAYASDYYLLGAAGLDTRHLGDRRKLQMASVDHAMWFHRPARADEWLLYVLDSPSASGSLGLAFGKMYSRDGRLVASTAQEGLIRRRLG